MKKLRMTSVAVLFCLLLPLLSACGTGLGGGTLLGKGSLDFDEIYRSDWVWEPEIPVKNPTSANLPEGATLVKGNAPLFVFRKDGENLVYNVDLDRTVLTVSTEWEVVLEDGLFVVTNPADYGCQLYAADGTLLFSAPAGTGLVKRDDVFFFEKHLIRMKDGAVESTYSMTSAFCNLTGRLHFAGDYVIEEQTRTVAYYSGAMERVATYELPAYAKNTSFWVLEDGKLLVQYRTEADPASTEYDILQSGIKYALHHELFDPSKQSTKELKLGVLIQDVCNRHRFTAVEGLRYEEIFTAAVPNYICYSLLVDGLVSSYQTHYTVLTNDGKAGARLDDLVKNQRGLIMPYGKDLYSVRTLEGYLLLDREGKTLHSVGVLPEPQAYGYSHDGVIYSLDLAPVESQSNKVWMSPSYYATLYCVQEFDAEGKGYNRFYRLDSTGTQEITAPEGKKLLPYSYAVSPMEGGYQITSSPTGEYYNTSYDYYSMQGELLFSRTTGDNAFESYPGRVATLVVNSSLDGKYTVLRVEGVFESGGLK